MLDWRLLPAIVLAYLVIAERSALEEIDWILLLTFVCFFIFSDNIGESEGVRRLPESLLDKSTYLTGVLASQIIGNVPAAILLSAFTDNWQELLLGLDISGLGTPVASLASLISICPGKELSREDT